MTMMVYPGPDGHHAGIYDGADGSGGRADIYREPASGRAVPVAVHFEHDTPPVEPEIDVFHSCLDRCQSVPVRNPTTAQRRSTLPSTIKRSRDRATTEPPTPSGGRFIASTLRGNLSTGSQLSNFSVELARAKNPKFLADEGGGTFFF